MADVLIVDDDGGMRAMVQILLRTEGCSVDVARDGDEALDKIRAHDFGVILLDLNLPGVGGLEVMERCVAERRSARIIVLTGIDTPETVLSALRGQAHQFLTKPVEPELLAEAVRRALTAGSNVPRIEVLSARPRCMEAAMPLPMMRCGKERAFDPADWVWC